MFDDLVGKESPWPPVLVVPLTVCKEKVPATSFCPGNFCMPAVSGCFQFLSWSLLRVNDMMVYLGGKESTYPQSC